MLGFAGASTGFPVIAADRQAAETAKMMSAALNSGSPTRSAPLQLDTTVASITEYDMPLPQDLPHDVAVDSSETGTVVITGMFSHTMYTLDPASGRLVDVALPVPNGGPRAVDRGCRATSLRPA